MSTATTSKIKARRVSQSLKECSKMTPSTDTEKIIAKRRLFDLEKFEPVSKEKEVEFSPAKSLSEATERIGNDESVLLRAINGLLRKQVISEAKAEMGGDNLVSPKAVSIFVNQFRAKFPAKDDSKESRREQTKQVHAFIKSQPGLMTAIKTVAAAFADVEDEDESNESETE